MGLYDYSNDPYTDTLLQAVYGAKVEPIQPAGMNVSSPSYPAVASASSGGGADQDMADAGGGIGSMFGSFMKGQASDAGGWSNLPRHWGSKVGLAEPIVKPTPTMVPDAGDPIGAMEAMNGGMPGPLTPYGSGNAGTFIKPLMDGAMPAAASAVTPALGPAMSLAQGKKKSAIGGALGLGASVALAPFLGPAALAIGPALGGFLGGMGEK